MLKNFFKQYEKDLNDLDSYKKCPNDFSLLYFLLLEFPFILISTFIFKIVYEFMEVLYVF